MTRNAWYQAGRPNGDLVVPADLPWEGAQYDAAGYLITDPDPYDQGSWAVTAGWKPSGWIPDRKPRRKRTGEGATHGLVSAYLKGCRCDECRMAARDRQRRYRAKKKQAEQ